MATGDLVFIDGNRAAIVIGEGVDDNGQPDGSVIVGTFAGARQVERGHYGERPSVAGDNPPSFTPETAADQPLGPQQIVVASAGESDTPEATTEQTQESATQQAGEGGILDVGPIAPGSAETEITSVAEFEQNQRIAELTAEVERLRGERGDTPVPVRDRTAAESGSEPSPGATDPFGPPQPATTTAPPQGQGQGSSQPGPATTGS